MSTKKKLSIIVFIIGLVGLLGGGTFLLVKFLQGPSIQDGEYLVNVGSWELDEEPGVVWEFTEIGKGKLTTNDHLNDYDFVWALEEGKIKIKTDWLYELNDEFEYRIEDENLILVDEELNEIRFNPARGVDSEITEDDKLVVGD